MFYHYLRELGLLIFGVVLFIVAFAAVFFLGNANAGTENLPDITTGSIIITRDLFNAERNAIQTDFVSRDASGTVAVHAGKLGTETYPWDQSYMHSLVLRSTSANSGSAVLVSHPSGGLKLTYEGYQISDNQDSSNTGGSELEATHLSASVTVVGDRPVMVMLNPDSTSISYVGATSIDTTESADSYTGNPGCNIIYKRDATTIAAISSHAIVKITDSGAVTTLSMRGDVVTPPGAFLFIDTPGSAATYNYSVYYSKTTASSTCDLKDVKLFVYEL